MPSWWKHQSFDEVVRADTAGKKLWIKMISSFAITKFNYGRRVVEIEKSVHFFPPRLCLLVDGRYLKPRGKLLPIRVSGAAMLPPFSPIIHHIGPERFDSQTKALIFVAVIVPFVTMSISCSWLVWRLVLVFGYILFYWILQRSKARWPQSINARNS